MESTLTPAAQYLRMSTEHQQYSLLNQSTAIQRYAETHHFTVICTYSDPAKSGLVLKSRPGLRQLLQDVVAGSQPYRVILVYDVSRWGRFQDSDEAAHYEFLCKSASVPVHYCAETFTNDTSLPNLLMKALKRTMAGEYSRELSVKVFEGQKRMASLGFKQGGVPGYGLARMLVSPDRCPKQPLAKGEYKSVATDRVILVPGRAHEVQCVRDIYRMLISDKKHVYAIARELNQRGVEYTGLSKWDYAAVYNILTHPKYMGCNVFGKTSQKLSTPKLFLSRANWLVTPEAFEPLVDEATYSEAQRILQDRTNRKSDSDLLDALRSLLATKGRLSASIIEGCENAASISTYRERFGSLQRAYELIGYGSPEQYGPTELRRRTQAMRDRLVAQIAAMFPDDVSVFRRGGRWRPRLKLRNRSMVSVLVVRSTKRCRAVRWQVQPVRHECRFVTLIARLNTSNDAFLDFHIFPRLNARKKFEIRLEDTWLNGGQRLTELSQFCECVKHLRNALPKRSSPIP